MVIIGDYSINITSGTLPKTLPRPVKSTFRYGLDPLPDILLSIHHGIENLRFFKFALKFLSCT